jgi:hypothetical protein
MKKKKKKKKMMVIIIIIIIIAVCSELHTEHINTLCGQNV